MYPQRSVMTCGLATALEPPHFNHAPAWGATKVWFSTTEQPESFNPRIRVGCDPFAARHLPCLSCFNPRTRVGCDFAGSPFCRHTLGVSIHAPAWGATTGWVEG